MDTKKRFMGKHLNIKFCGLKKQGEVNFCTANGISFIGFVFCEDSPRSISLERFQSLDFKSSAPVVAVFRNPTVKQIEGVLALNRVDFIQLHNSTDDVSYYFKDKIKIIKAFHGENFSQNDFQKYNYCDYFLFDGKNAGSGIERDFSFAKNLHVKKDFFLAGGINISNVHKVLTYTNFIDVSSGIEEMRGIKSISMMKDFITRCNLQLFIN